MCYCKSSCVYSLKSKQALCIERGFVVFNIHSLKVPVHKIRFCFVVCYGICEAQCSRTDANATVLLHFIMLIQRAQKFLGPRGIKYLNMGLGRIVTYCGAKVNMKVQFTL